MTKLPRHTHQDDAGGSLRLTRTATILITALVSLFCSAGSALAQHADGFIGTNVARPDGSG